jgi:hypothetical protein
METEIGLPSHLIQRAGSFGKTNREDKNDGASHAPEFT